MKRFLSSFLAVAIVGMLSFSILAQNVDLKEHFEFRNDILVGTTLVKKGRYLIRFDQSTSQMTVFDGDDMVVTVPATMRTADRKFESDALLTIDTTEGLRLTGLRLGGQREELFLSDTLSLNEN